jgi:AAA15 family ATPase/GTPase
MMTAHFLTEIEIKEFKCFHDFKAAGFKRVNLIGGKNNIGKTALMEAIWINVHSIDIETMINAIFNITFLRDFLNVNNYDEEKYLNNIKIYTSNSNVCSKGFLIEEKDGIKEYIFNINGEITKVNAKELNINSYKTVYNIKFIGSKIANDIDLRNFYEVIQKKDLEDLLNNFVKEFDSAIETFKVIGVKPQCKSNGEYRDIIEFGDGLKHYISIICALYVCENGYLFIDEIDNGIYYEHFDRLWEIILTLSKETNCQVFAATHSKEMLESFAKVVKNSNETEVSFISLFKNKNQEIKAITRDYEMLLNSIDAEREVR